MRSAGPHALWTSFTARGLPAFEIGLQNGIQHQSKYSIHDTNPEGWTALHVAAHAGLFETVEILLRAGADVNCKTPKGRTPAFQAAWAWELDVLKVLLKHGADLNICDDYGVSIADRASDKSYSSRNFKTNAHQEAVNLWLKQNGAKSMRNRGSKSSNWRGNKERKGSSTLSVNKTG